MGLYDEEELKRRKAGKSTADDRMPAVRFAGKALTSSPAGMAAAGIGEAVRFGKKGFKDAAGRPTVTGQVGRALRTAATLPVAAAYGALKGPAKQAASAARGAKEVGREFLGIDSTAKPASVSRAQLSPEIRAKIAGAGASPSIGTARTTASPPSNLAPTATTLDEVVRSKYGENSGVPGTGYITSSSGSVRMGPDGKAIMTGSPVGDPGLPVSAKSRERKRYTGRMIPVAGGYRLPVRNNEVAAPASRRVSDIPEPRTIGGVPGYRRQVEASKADIAAEQAEAQRLQQQSQFVARQGQQQGQFNKEQSVRERTAASAESRDSATGDYRRKELGLKQDDLNFRKEQAAIATRRSGEKESKIAAARDNFENAETIEEKVRAGNILNSLNSARVEIPKAGVVPGLTKKETSQQTQNAFKAYSDAGGENMVGADFATWFAQTDPTGYNSAFGGLAPADVNGYSKIMDPKVTDEQLTKSAIWARGAKPGETPAQFRRRLSREFRRRIGS